MSMIRPNKSQKVIMYSKEISSLPDSTESKNLLPIIQEDAIYPRVFPNTRVPLKVAITRKIKDFEQMDLSITLRQIDWKYGKGLLDLKYYNCELQIVMDECTQDRISRGLIKGRAYDAKSGGFKEFSVSQVVIENEEFVLTGFFTARPKEIIKINKFYVCLAFENPLRFAEIVLKANQIREQFLNSARYNFYIDNIDLEEAPQIPKYLLNDITHKIGIDFLGREGYLQLNQHFKRTMNEILFVKSVREEPHIFPQGIQKKNRKKNYEYKPKNKVITLMKDNKKFKLVLKSLKTKIEQIEAKSIFFKDEMVHLMHEIKGKLQQIAHQEIFDLKEELHVIDRFVADNMLMVGYFNHFIDEKLVESISLMIRKMLVEHPEGWFKIYETDRNTYLLSKLRRLFVFIEQNIKSAMKDHIKQQVQRYIGTFRKRLPILIQFETFSNYKLTYQHTAKKEVEFQPLISIGVAFFNDSIEMIMKRQRIQEMFTKNIVNVFKKLQSINTPQNKALIEVFAIFKNQYGIDIQIPLSPISNVNIEQKINVNELQYQWIRKDLDQLYILIDKQVQTLSVIQARLLEITTSINLPQIMKDNVDFRMSIKDVLHHMKDYISLHNRVEELFPATGINFGLFYIDYKVAKEQLNELLHQKIGSYKSLLIREYQVVSLALESKLISLEQQINEKPNNIYEMVKQRKRLEILEEIIIEFNEEYQVELFNLCNENYCTLPRIDSERRWKNTRKITLLFQLRVSKKKEYEQIRKKIALQVQKQEKEIEDILGLFKITLYNVKNNTGREFYIDNYNKLEHLKQQYNFVKKEIQDIRYKEIHLEFEQHDFQAFEDLQKEFLALYNLWESIYRWEISKNIWYHKSFSDFQIDKPENILTEITNNIKKIEKNVKQDFGNQLHELLTEAKKEIDFFQDNHLRLLKILKKKGFNRKHLQKIGIFIDVEIEDLNLQQAIDLDFLDKIDEIQAVSNDAWNEFYLEQTLQRVFAQLMTMKYDIIHYLDKKGNEIPLINNYSPLQSTLEQVILDLQSVQFNPMKGIFQKRINDLLQKSLYMSKSLQSCQIFQKKLVELHPIFDSTDVVKQLPVQNKQFTKILRSWIEMLKYMRKIVSVYDSCNGQNIHQKLIWMINGIQNVKVGLANYLQKKRQGFSRFYLLTDQELYELFASTNDMNILSKHISKLFHSVTGLQFDEQYIIGIISSHTQLTLQSQVSYKRQNLEEWLSHMERSIKGTIASHIDRLMKTKQKWMNILGEECSQAMLLCYEIEKTVAIQLMSDFKKLIEKQRNMIKKLVDKKKNEKLSVLEAVNLGSMLVLALYYSEKLNELIQNNVTDPNHFQLRKMMKVYWKDDEDVKLKSFQTEISYGYEYLGLVKRLVLTNLTERMQLIYMSAIKYSLGGSAIGPAGTGKSQTTKDIARICGKSCLIYNCSESLGIDIIIKILKGMVVTGLWICFDEFNRLNFQVLNMISEQLNIIFKYKAMGLKLQLEYDRQVISFKPDFHLCITYNPTYIGRQNIPKTVSKHFRTVAMVNCDKKVICKLLFYSKGFKTADQLSIKLTRIFEYCEILWYGNILYDFGLRTLISIIQLAGILYKGQGEGADEVIQAMKILVLPRLTTNHQQIFLQMILQQFSKANIRSKDVDSQANRIRDILDVRLGIILLGQIFTGKTTAMNEFQKLNKEYRVQHIHINSLSVEQIYGETNPTTRLWKQGYLTKKIRQYFNQDSSQKMIIYIKGVIYSQWIQNLNSVLDNSRSLSLSSGEIIYIPENIKFMINCSHLDFASPATISRSCVISLKQKQLKQLLNVDNDSRTRRVIIESYEEIMQKIKKHMKFSIDERLIIHWANKYVAKTKMPLTLQSFWHILSLVFEGLLQPEGKKILNEEIHKLFSIESEIYDYFWDGKLWKKIKDSYGVVNLEGVHDKVYVGQLVIKDLKYKKIEYLNKIFLQRYTSEDIFLLVGKQNTGKSSAIESIHRQIDKKLFMFSKINLTRKIKNTHLYSMIEGQLHKKSNKRKGILNGKELVIFIDDINLPETNKYKYKEVSSFLTLLLEKKGCYNYNNLEFENIDDIYLIANDSISRNQIGFNKQFLKYSLPYFVNDYEQEEIRFIFKDIIDKNVTQVQLKPKYFDLSNKLIEIMKEVESICHLHLPNYLAFHFIHFKKIIVNVLLWNINLSTINHEDLITDIFIFETDRMLLSRIFKPESIKFINDIICSRFGKRSQKPILLQSFEKSINGTIINPQKCSKVEQFNDFIREVEYICDQYILSLDTVSNESLVVFPELCVMLCRVSRGMSLKKGNISLIGLPKCGKKVMVELCNYLLHGRIYKTSDRYDQKNWYETVKSATKQSLLNKCPSILVLQNAQMKEIIQKEELNLLLKTTFLPHIYSEADYEQLIYLFQSQLIKKSLATNKQNTIKLFINYLQENLKIVILFNPAMKEFKQDILSYPAIAKHTEFFWVVEWPTEALLMIATQTVVQTQFETYLPIFPDIHQICKKITAQKTKIPQWQGLYLDFLRIFNKLHENNKKQLQSKRNMLERSFNVIKQTEMKLQSTRDQIKRLQPAILLLQKETIKTIKSLNIQKANAEAANDQLMKKQVECSKIISQSNIVKLRLETTNTRVEEELKKAWENVFLVKQSHIAEIKSLMNPSELIKIVITAIVIIINEGDIEILRNKTEDGLATEENYFETGKRFILSKDSKQITKILTQYKKQKLTKQKIALIEQKCLNHPRWNIIQAKSANKAIFYFFLWVEAVVKYFRLFQETMPLRQELTKITVLVTEKNKEIEIVKKELNIYETKIVDLTKNHKQKTERLHEYTNKIILFQKMLNRGYEILKQIESQKVKWQQYRSVIDTKFNQNLGNSIISASLIIYNSPHTLQIRNTIMKEIKQLLESYTIAYNQENIYWYMQNDEEIILKELGIYHNEYILNNLKIIEKTNKMVFIVDPQEEGLKYLKNKYKIQGIMIIQKIDYKHKLFRKTLQNAMFQGLILFVEISGTSLPYLIQFLINPKFKKNESSGSLQILFDEKYLPYNSKFKLYLFTSNISEEYSIQLISKVTTTNFAITEQQLEEKLINTIISIQFPEENQELEELNRTNIKDNIQLKSIENRILNIFANMTNCEDILKTQEILQILSTSNRLHKQIGQRIHDSYNKRNALLARRQDFRARARKTSKLYFLIQKLAYLSPFYRYSFNWFISLFQHNINNFTDILSEELCKGLPINLKIIPPLIIAENEFSKIPFHLLFNQKSETSQFILQRYPLKVSKVRLEKIVSNIRESGIQNLDRLVRDSPEKFKALFDTSIDIILEAIPDEYSTLQFFQKILMINCFRPDCTIKLLKDWFDVNLGATYNTQLSKIMSNTACNVPIMVYEHSESLTSSVDYIYKIFDTYFRQTGKSVCYINANNCGLDRIRILMESGFTNDQWILLEGLGDTYEELTSLIILLMEESDFKRKEVFKFWIVINEYELKYVSEKLVKLCNKIVFEQQVDIIKKVSTVFNSQKQKLESYSESSQLNKKKYILNQLCLFHYLLNEKYKYKQKLWNQPIYFYETDLELSIKYLYFTQTDDLKRLYPSIVTDIIYGGKITDQQDIQVIALHIQQAMKNTVLDRNIFWQTVWADDKFPKSPQEYEHYLRAFIIKHNPPFKSLYEQYGINSFVINHNKQKQYKQISQFYNNTKEDSSKKDMLSLMKAKLNILFKKIAEMIHKMNTKSYPLRDNPFFSYLMDEQDYYQNKIKKIAIEFKQYLEMEDVISNTDEEWCMSIIGNKMPPSWRIKTILTLQSWIDRQIQGYNRILEFNYEDDMATDAQERYEVRLKRVYSLQLNHNFSTFCQNILKMNETTYETHYLVWQPLKIDQVADGSTIKVDRWYIWNAVFDKQIKPLKQGTIEQNYYTLLPKGTIGVIDNSDAKKLTDFESICVYQHSFEYGGSTNPIISIYMPTSKQADREWLKRMRVHLALAL